MDQTNRNQQFTTESFTIIRPPIDKSTGKPYASCRYAIYPGWSLAQSEPELVVLMYDSLLQQYPNTAMMLYKGYGSYPLLNRKCQQRLLTKWRSLGKPTVILTSPEDRKFFRDSLGEIPTVSLYEKLLSHSVSGGCNRELYRLSEPENYGVEQELRELSEMMGVVCQTPCNIKVFSTTQQPLWITPTRLWILDDSSMFWCFKRICNIAAQDREHLSQGVKDYYKGE